MNRRDFVRTGALGTAALGWTVAPGQAAPQLPDLKGNVNHSVCKWCYPNLSLEAMQIMEGDVIRTLREHKDYIAHYHTGGNPG